MHLKRGRSAVEKEKPAEREWLTAGVEGQHKMSPLEYRIELSQHLGSFRFFFIDF